MCQRKKFIHFVVEDIVYLHLHVSSDILEGRRAVQSGQVHADIDRSYATKQLNIKKIVWSPKTFPGIIYILCVVEKSVQSDIKIMYHLMAPKVEQMSIK